MLKPSARPLRFDPDELNDFFATTAQRTLETQATTIEDLTCLIDNLPDVLSCSILGLYFIYFILLFCHTQ